MAPAIYRKDLLVNLTQSEIENFGIISYKNRMLEGIRFFLNIKLDFVSPMGLTLVGQIELWKNYLHFPCYRKYLQKTDTARLIDKVYTSALFSESQYKKILTTMQ